MKDIIKDNFTVICLTLITIASIIANNEGWIFLWFLYGIYKLITEDY